MTPITAAVVGQPDFWSLRISVGKADGLRLVSKAVFSLLVVTAALFCLVIKPLNLLMERMASGEAVDPTTKACPECWSTIPFLASRCSSRTAILTTVAPMEVALRAWSHRTTSPAVCASGRAISPDSESRDSNMRRNDLS